MDEVKKNRELNTVSRDRSVTILRWSMGMLYYLQNIPIYCSNDVVTILHYNAIKKLYSAYNH